MVDGEERTTLNKVVNEELYEEVSLELESEGQEEAVM